MGFWKNFFFPADPPEAAGSSQPFNMSDGGMLIRTSEELEEALRAGQLSSAGPAVSVQSAMRVSAVYACVRIIAGAVATMPLHIKRRVDARIREDASDAHLWKVLNKKPNGWQKPAGFRRMMQAHVLLRGNAYAMIVRSRGEVISLIPLHPDHMQVEQMEDLSIRYTYTRKDGRRVVFNQSEIFHLMGLSLDGITGVTPITYARETIGLSLSMENHGANMFQNGARVTGILKHPGTLGEEGQASLRASLDAYREGGAREGKELILEEGMDYLQMGMKSTDAQWLESRKFSRSDIAMFFGVPPHMIGDTEKSTSWGSGIEQQSQGFVTYTLEDHLTMWEETINADCLPEDSILYARFNRNALVRGDIKSRWEAHVKAMQWGVRSPNDIRKLEDENPREGGDIYYDPPNTAGGQDKPSSASEEDE